MAKINDQYDIGTAFEAIENELIASMIRNFENHKQEEADEKKHWSMWQAEMLKSLEKYKHDNQKKYGKQFKDINKKIEALISLARSEGGMNQEKRILEEIKNGFPAKKITKGGTAEFFKVNDRKLDALIQATTADMQKAEAAVLRMANDQYRKIIYNAQVYANTGAGTYEKAVDMATKDFLSAGLNCVEYANGARHTLSDYADMAIRTASKRAYLQGEGEMRQQWGLHLVIMNKRGSPCPKCLPFVGKILIDDVWSGGSSKDGKYPLMSSAVAAGLYHPRCKDSHTTYFPGITKVDPKYNKQEIADIEDTAKQEAKQQYAERQEKKFGRLADFSLDPENQQRYEQKRKEWKHVRMRTGDMSSQEYAEDQKAKAFFGKPLDVTEEWKAEKKSPSNVKELFEYNVNGETYKVDGKRVLLDYSMHEKKIAELIANETGRRVEMVPRVTFPQGIQTPDYLINGSGYDLKTPLGNGKNTLYGMVKSKKKQANNFVICADKTELTVEELRRQIEDIFRSRNTAFVNTIVLIKNNKIVNIYKRNK
ncbi:MAG: phage minor capsid protein [Blautia obeum]|nr:phage minor capsid protein [Blautia faecis]